MSGLRIDRILLAFSVSKERDNEEFKRQCYWNGPCIVFDGFLCSELEIFLTIIFEIIDI